MSKEVFGEYAAFDSGKGIRFQKNKKLVSESAIPPEVVAYLKNKLVQPDSPTAEVADKPTPKAKFPRPTEEELKKMREESLKVKPELQLTPEEAAARASAPEEPQEEPLHEGDFDEPPQESIDTTVDYMEKFSIHTADIKDIAQVLYDRFGVYTIWLNNVPQTDEINPITGERFTRYHQGIAYQSLVRSRNNGFFNKPAELGRDAMVEGRVARDNYQATAGDPRLAGVIEQSDATKAPQNSFEYRTSPAANNSEQSTYIAHEKDEFGNVRAVRREIPNAAQYSGKKNNSRQRFDAGQDEMIVEPQFGQKVIRPDW